MAEWKIGEIKQVNGEWYQCVVAIQGCRECSFRTRDYCTRYSECMSIERSDKTSVIFKKLEKVGEPYYSSYYKQVLQEYKYYTSPIISDTKVHILKQGIVRIEIKQTKEDMEEKKVRLKKEDIDFLYNKFIEITEDCVVKGYNIDNVQHEFGKLFLIKDSDTKLNLKPFDLEAAKSGKPVCTRDGRKARIICFDRFCCDEISTIVACVLSKDGKDENVIIYSSDGFMADKQHPYADDLMMLPEKKKGWINIYNADTTFYYVDGRVFETKDEAVKEAKEEVEKKQREKNEYIDTIRVEWEE